MINVADDSNDYSVTEYLENGWATELWAAQEDTQNPLHTGSGFQTRSEHTVDGVTTLADAGMDAPHPYLVGNQLPAYVGPCADSACGWIDSVLALDTITSLTQWTD